MNLPELLVKCLNKVLEMRGQDCFLKVGSVPRIRVGGNVVTLPFNAIREEDTKMMAEHLLNPAQADLLKKNCSVDFAFTLPGTEQRFRGNIFYQQGSYSLVFRCLWKSSINKSNVRRTAIKCRIKCSYDHHIPFEPPLLGLGVSKAL